jgi:hypothetical protein
MTHEEAFLLMMDTLDQASSRADQDRLQQHLFQCAECAAEWEALQAVEGLLVSAPMIPVPAGFAARVMGQLDSPSWTRMLGALFALGLGSVLALLVVAVPALVVLLVFSTAYTDPVQFASWITWLRGLASVGGTLIVGVATTLRLFFVEVAGSPAVLGWALAAALAAGLWAFVVRRYEPAPVAPWGGD